MTKKILKTFILVFTLLISLSIMSTTVKAADRIYWYGKLTQGKDIFYWIDSGCEYTGTIPQAVSKLRYPSGMWNPMVLNKTTTKSYSKMDFYQNYDSGGPYASTRLFKPKTGSTENIAYTYELDYIDWQYGKITINDYLMAPLNADLRSTIILHEICHIYGGKDVYDNPYTIMYGWGDSIQVRGLTSDFNDILVQKYNY